jgi:glyoxylase-like metal-dependent hydrolase (beta-lactamase superfamily II)
MPKIRREMKIMQSHGRRKRIFFRGVNHLASIALLLAVSALISGAWATGEKPSRPDGFMQKSDRPASQAKAIDFSSKHDILIKNEDGSLTPMDVPYFKSTLIAPGTWQILSDGDYTYLVEGDNEALVIDSGYGAGNIREYCQTLTKKPVRNIANTHDHFDHTANNSYFERAYMSAETKKKATIPFPSFAGINFPRDYPIEVIGDGYKFQLGNRELEVFDIPNHGSGGLAFLDRRERVLFSGDEIMRGGIRLNCSVAQLERNMRKIAAHRSEYDRLCAGSDILAASYVDKFLANAQYILAGHEGEPVKPQLRPVQAPGDPSGPVIYSRRSPRPPDRPKNMGEANENLRKMTYADCDITYDIRRIKD